MAVSTIDLSNSTERTKIPGARSPRAKLGMNMKARTGANTMCVFQMGQRRVSLGSVGEGVVTWIVVGYDVSVLAARSVTVSC